MAVTRRFLDSKVPALTSAGAFLLEKYRRDGVLDLRSVIVVVPGGRAGRRLLEVLVEKCEREGLVLFPPAIVTEGRLPELLYTPKRPFASDLTQLLAWAAALKKAPKGVIEQVVPHAPPGDDFTRWLQLAGMIRRLHTELAADGIHFGHVAKGEKKHSGYHEKTRWEALRQIQEEYLRTLDGLNQWDIQTARLVGIEKKEFQTTKDIVLLGTVDLNRAMRQILDQVAGQVTALIHAPEEWADRFDQYGCLVPAAWKSAEIPMRDEQIERVDGPADQAEAVTRWMGSLGGKYRGDQIVVGAADESLVPQLQRQLAQCNVPTRWVAGKELAQTGPYRLLEVAARYAQRRRFSDLAALARHPDVEEWLASQLKSALAAQKKVKKRKAPDIHTALDLFYNEQFPARIDSGRLEADKERWPAIQALVRAVDAWLAPIAARSQYLFAWASGLRVVLRTIYGHRILDTADPSDRYLLKACEEIEAALESLALVPAELEPEISLEEAIHLVLEPLEKTAIPPLPAPGAVEILGWLELALDDSPALAVTSLNEGFVPSNRSSDHFLPNSLRTQLGLMSSDRLYSRDAYALSVLLASRQELRLIVGHRDAQNNPLVPSRLLFAADEETACRRALSLFEKLEEAPPRRNLLAAGLQLRNFSNFFVPYPKRLVEPIPYISVTQFRAYLACKYRFYLGQILGLDELTDRAAELDGAAFGSLVHDVLQHFGRADDRIIASTRPKEILDFLLNRLEDLSQARFGREASRAALRLQLEQARHRLTAFAAWQARQTESGWRIVYSEDFDKQLEFDFPATEGPMKIRGRIDRIDYHAQDRIFRVLDYKTTDTAKTPQQTHLKNGEWIDLQLPLYRYLVRGVQLEAGRHIEGEVQLGYVNLPKDLTAVGEKMANWSPEDLERADQTARDVITGITQGKFWPLCEEGPRFPDAFGAICQDHLIGARRLAEELSEEGEEP